ncbi:MAG: hypothetical protein ACP59X_01460 [Solidesulfovibrio sp. DCME]|uniref:hypothetical protein n=1 Tax=Solidesulfovibrio sp. DCME TaxID=3447380 RepID=UPI003D0F9BF6
MPDAALDLTLTAPVQATDAAIGRVEHIIIDPHLGKATHIVVREDALPNTLRLVAEKYIASASPQGVHLNIPHKRVGALKEYIQTEYFSPAYFLTLAKAEEVKLPMAPASWTVERPATPEGSVALAGHEPVRASDGKVGRVDGVLCDRHTGRVTHLLLRQGHLWGTREVQVPAGLVAGYEDGEVVLSATKAAIGALPDIHEG